ncbi:hypothetical protein [Clostridium sardiniense]|uniref:hypothetical protein n=1 Tax=Clostridium sardiniense TaxID=29369 RepID=UPI003D332271
MSQMNCNKNTDSYCNVKYDPCYDKGSKPCKDSDTKVEFRYDERTPATPTPIPVTGVELLEVEFNRVARGNRVWLSGVISINNNAAAVATITIRIVKDSPNIAPTTIYTLFVEVDAEGRDDQQAIPFSHVDVNVNNLFDVEYSVIVSASIAGVVTQGPNTLTALRFENK